MKAKPINGSQKIYRMTFSIDKERNVAIKADAHKNAWFTEE